MRRDARVLLEDINLAAADIGRYVEGIDVHAYLSDGEKQAAVERKFEIVGEALNRLHRHDPELADRIPGLRMIVDFCNVLIHAYDRVNSKRVWSYATNLMPQLRQHVQALLEQPD